MQSRLLLGLLLLLGLAGCTGIPFAEPEPQDRAIFVNITNQANTSHTFEVWMGEDPLDQVQVHMANRSDYTVEMGEVGVGVHDTGDYQITSSLTFPERAAFYGRYTLEPGGTQTWTMPEPYPDTVFVVVIYNDDKVIGWVETSCDEGVMTGFGVTNHHYGPSGAFNCV
jgi:hypothetical protein